MKGTIVSQTLPLTKTTYYWNNLIQLAIGASTVPLAHAAKMGLGTTVITPGPKTSFADVGEANYTGYLESTTITWTAIVNEIDGSQSSYSNGWLFRCTGASSVAVANAFVTDGVGSASIGNASTGILASCAFLTPFNFVNPGDGFNLTVAWNEGVVSANSNAAVET